MPPEDDFIDDVELDPVDPQDDADLDPVEVDDPDPLDPDGDPAPEGDDRQQDQRQPSRAERRIQTLTEEVRALREQSSRPPAPAAAPQVDPAVLQRQEADYLANLTYEQQIEYRLNKQAQQFEARLAGLHFQNADVADQANFRAFVAEQPAVKGLAKEVEERLATLRRQGQNVPRETLAKFILGERALAGASRAKGRQTADGQRQLNRQNARPTNGRGDVAPSGDRRQGNDTAAARKTRLEGLEI